ncbi:hypothetical protein FHR99_003185 [Litorivivens lipolytica]|uniref:Uncharacterized protein n=1 Tax=Litorivivens lipolytica TaxID=1524264 RepID=A0A7W4W7F6_9GAMM|nr:hypothetical protein [Litorivivens lipolytica]MBB3048911.1 hypothetical protein [Litorivivens lipolytica]
MDFTLIKLALLDACDNNPSVIPSDVRDHLANEFPADDSFKPDSTGGGCMALVSEMTVGTTQYLLVVTQADESDLPEPDNWAISLHSTTDWIGDDYLISVCHKGTVCFGS